MKNLRIVFAGTPAFTLPSLEALFASNHQICAVYTQPDRPAGRGRQLQASPVKAWALEHHIPVHQPLHFRDPNAVETLSSFAPDLLVVIAYGLILPKSVLDLPRLGCLNVHASLLPRWRGASPIQHAILAGDTETGVTMMQMDSGMDTGAILSQTPCPIYQDDTAATLHDRLAQLATEPLLSILEALANDQTHPETQDERFATYAPKIQKTDAAIDWEKPAEAIHRQIRAFNPWPIAYTHNQENTLRIYQADMVPGHFNQKPGTIVSIEKTGVLIATGEQALLIKQLQFPGGKIVSASDWFHSGHKQLQVNQVMQPQTP